MILRVSRVWWVVGSNMVGFLLVISIHGPVHAFCGTCLSKKPAFTTRWGSISSLAALRVVNKGMEGGGQGRTFDDQRFELEAMGGDPFFLSDDNDDQQVDTAIVDSTGIHLDLLSEMSMGATAGAMDLLQRAQLGVAPISDRSAAPRNSFRADEIEAMGGDPFFLMGEDDDDTADEENADEVEPMAFDVLSEMAMSGGAVMNLLQEISNPLGKMENNRQTKSSDAEKMADEILGMGGDPSFLDDDDDVDNKEESDNNAYEQLLAMGGDPFFLLDDDIRDGSTILSTDEEEERNDDDFNPSAMEMLAQVAALSENFDGAGGGGAMKILSEMGSSDSDVDDDDEDSDSEFTLLEELEAMGGDPFFLDDPESDEMVQTSSTVDSLRSSGATASEKRRVTDGQGPSPRMAKFEVIEEADWGWDGFVDEDAHYDLD